MFCAVFALKYMNIFMKSSFFDMFAIVFTFFYIFYVFTFFYKESRLQ